MNYVLRGWTRVEFEDIGEVRFEAGDSWYQPPKIKHEVLEFSDDFEVIEITMPADFPTAEAPADRRCKRACPPGTADVCKVKTNGKTGRQGGCGHRRRLRNR